MAKFDLMPKDAMGGKCGCETCRPDRVRPALRKRDKKQGKFTNQQRGK